MGQQSDFFTVGCSWCAAAKNIHMAIPSSDMFCCIHFLMCSAMWDFGWWWLAVCHYMVCWAQKVNPIWLGVGADLPPPSRICVYAWVYAYTRANFVLLFLILSVEEGTTLLTPKKITAFIGTQKVGLICLTFIRGTLTNLIDPLKKSLFPTIRWGGSRYLKVVNSHVWHQSW